VDARAGVRVEHLGTERGDTASERQALAGGFDSVSGYGRSRFSASAHDGRRYVRVMRFDIARQTWL
jgi:hypothetical protein